MEREVKEEMKAETLSMVVGKLDDLRDEVAAEVEEDREEKKEVLALFEKIRPVVIEKAGARIIASNKFMGR